LFEFDSQSVNRVKLVKAMLTKIDLCQFFDQPENTPSVYSSHLLA